MTRISPRITTTGFSSSTVDDAKTDISSNQRIEDVQDKSLSTAVKIIPKGSPPPTLRRFLEMSKRMSEEKNEQSLPQETGATKKPQSRGMHHLSLKKFFDSIPPGVAENAMLSAGSIACSFGAGAAGNNIARSYGNPAVKVTGALFPMVAGMASAYIEKTIRETFDVKSTESQYASHSAISPAALMITNYAYGLSKLPKFPPNTPAGMATTMVVTGLGAGFGGGLTEWAAQMSEKNASSSTSATSNPDNRPTTFENGLARTITQIPAVYLNKAIAAKATGAGGIVPKNLLLSVPAAISIPYMFRNEVASKIAESRNRQSSNQASKTDAPRTSGN